MKAIFSVALYLGLLALQAGQSRAQSYSVEWFTIDGGGGTSTGGVYSVSGTIGQPDAGKLTGGNYILVGGFWSVVQQDGMPTLSIELRAGNLVLSWSASVGGVQVQSATQLTPVGADWATFEGNPVQVGDEFELTIGPALTPPDPIRFFRLHKP